MSRILCIHAHPDDAEFLCAGTLILLASKGHRVTIATMTAGDCGSDIHPPREISSMRKDEGRRAAASIGAEYDCLGFGDLSIFVDDASRRKVTAALRRHRPEIVLTASPADYHCDHEATSKLVTDACFGASAPNYDTSAFDSAPPLPSIPHLYYLDPAEGTDREGNVILPQFVVNVEDVMEQKGRMLECHESQRAWLKRQHGMEDFIGMMSQWSEARGRLAGFKYGEGFRHYTGHPWPVDPLLESLIGESLIAPPAK